MCGFWFSEVVDSFCSNAWLVSRWVQVGVLAASKPIRMHPPGICKISKAKNADWPAKIRATPLRTHTCPLRTAVVANNTVWRIYRHVRCFVECYRLMTTVYQFCASTWLLFTIFIPVPYNISPFLCPYLTFPIFCQYLVLLIIFCAGTWFCLPYFVPAPDYFSHFFVPVPDCWSPSFVSVLD